MKLSRIQFAFLLFVDSCFSLISANYCHLADAFNSLGWKQVLVLSDSPEHNKGLTRTVKCSSLKSVQVSVANLTWLRVNRERDVYFLREDLRPIAVMGDSPTAQGALKDLKYLGKRAYTYLSLGHSEDRGLFQEAFAAWNYSAGFLRYELDSQTLFRVQTFRAEHLTVLNKWERNVTGTQPCTLRNAVKLLMHVYKVLFSS